MHDQWTLHGFGVAAVDLDRFPAERRQERRSSQADVLLSTVCWCGPQAWQGLFEPDTGTFLTGPLPRGGQCLPRLDWPCPPHPPVEAPNALLSRLLVFALRLMFCDAEELRVVRWAQSQLCFKAKQKSKDAATNNLQSTWAGTPHPTPACSKTLPPPTAPPNPTPPPTPHTHLRWRGAGGQP